MYNLFFDTKYFFLNLWVHFYAEIKSVGELESVSSQKGNDIPKRNLKLSDQTGTVTMVTWYDEATDEEIEPGLKICVTGAYVSVWQGTRAHPSTFFDLFNFKPASPKSTQHSFFLKISDFDTCL